MSELKVPKLLILFSMLYLTIMLTGVIVLNKTIMVFSYPVTATALISPLWFIMGDIIAEIYGFKIARKIFYSAVACQWIYVTAGTYLIHMHSPENWHYQLYYNYVFSGLFRLNFSMLIAIIIAGNFNIYFITRWKFLLKGKYFWLRSMGASGGCEILYTLLASFFVFVGTLSWPNLISFTLLALMLKIIYTIILVYPANYITFLVKKYAGIDVYDNNIINPFKSFYK